LFLRGPLHLHSRPATSSGFGEKNPGLLAFLVLFFVAAARYAMDSKGMVTTVLRIPIEFFYAILPIGALLTFYEYLKTVIVEIRSSSHR
jgi:TRAP-type C4-dicarboxylate transport system permease small subunit